MKYQYIAFLVLACSPISCSVQRDMKHMLNSTDHVDQTTKDMRQSTDEVKQATQDMKKSTDQMVQTTSDLSKKTDDMKKATDDLYNDLRQADALRARTDSLSLMEKEGNQIVKINHAAHYFMAFEFQLWKGRGQDSPEKLDALRRDAINEFMRVIQGYISQSRSLSPLGMDSNSKNLNAMVAAMHSVNSNAIGTIKEDGNGVMGLLKEGLKAKADLEAGKLALTDLPEYKKSVLEFEDDVTYLLQLRMNFLPAMVISQIGAPEGKQLNLLTQAKILLTPWTPYVGSRNIAQLDQCQSIMGAAQKVRAFLTTINVTPRYDDLLMHVLGNMRFPAVLKTAGVDKTPHDLSQEALKNQITAFLQKDSSADR